MACDVCNCRDCRGGQRQTRGVATGSQSYEFVLQPKSELELELELEKDRDRKADLSFKSKS